MKRHLFTALTVATMCSAMAQNNFFTKTCYRGAFAPAPAAMWTEGWTEWDPQNKVYPAPTMTVTGDITTNTTWPSGSVVLLSTQCYVKNNAILTIQPGVIVLGDKAAQGACLVVTRGSQVIADGTAQQPIVFTSNQAPGSRELGDWGGILLLGKASNNLSNGVGNIEGFPVQQDTEHGGGVSPDDNDNSGILRYVRIEFGGYVYQPNQEINGLTMGSVGRGTVIDYVQTSFVNDDAFEWFGGTVNCKHLVSYRNLDDDFDTDNGYSGMVQFCLAIKDPAIADNPNVSTSEVFECDNNATGTAATPFTKAIFSNVTAIGPLRGNPSAQVDGGHRRGLRIRRNAQMKILNSIFLDNATRGIFIDGSAVETHAVNGDVVFANNILAGYGQRATEQGTFNIVNANSWVMANANDTLKSSANILTTPYSYTSPDYRPAPGSIALMGASFSNSVLATISASTSLVAQAAMNNSICIGNNDNNIQPVEVVASSTISNGYCSISWSAPAGVAISNSTATNPTFTISTVGTFTINMIVLDAEGTKTVSNVVSTYTCLDVSVKEHNRLIGAQLFPNPAGNAAELLINSGKMEVLSVSVYDITGKNAGDLYRNHQLMAGENRLHINTQSLQNGVYFVTLSTPNGKETVKLIVNH